MRLFQTECIEDMPYEQFRVLVASINQANAEASKEKEPEQKKENKKGKISFRVVSE